MDDRRKDDKPHGFAWQMMFAEGMKAALAGDRAVFEPVPTTTKPGAPSGDSLPRMVLRIHADSPLKLSTDVFRPTDYHAPAAFPRLRATVESVNPRFIAVLLPLPATVEEPKVRFEASRGKRLVTIEWKQHADRFEWTESDGSVDFL